MNETRKARVAIVGSGMAGLITAYLLNNDPQRRYQVELFESGTRLSLDSASHSIPDPKTGLVNRIDVPMRAFAGGFYKNLISMYDYLGLNYHTQRFVFHFSTANEGQTTQSRNPYFIHTSNNHRLPPFRPDGLHILAHVLETAYVLFWYAWFSICCLLVPSRSISKDKQVCESFKSYASRIRLPEYFLHFYLLPLMSSVATCPHSTLLNFPALDVISYKKYSHRQQHFVLSRGVQDVERVLSKNLVVHYSTPVIKVEISDTGVRIWHETKHEQHRIDTACGHFDKVILAVSPNVVQRIFKPLSTEMSRIPIIQVQSVLHSRLETSLLVAQRSSKAGQALYSAQIINLRTLDSTHPQTEAVHVQPSGYVVTTCPLDLRTLGKVIKKAEFPRVLRTPQSRAIVNRIFERERETENCSVHWRNGDGGVWLAGGWCWDGMVLLEGCVVSAMRIANDLNVDVPWQKHN